MSPISKFTGLNRHVEKATRLRKEVGDLQASHETKESLNSQIDAALSAAGFFLNQEELPTHQKQSLGDFLIGMSLMFIEDRIHRAADRESMIKETLARHADTCPFADSNMSQRYSWVKLVIWPATVVAVAASVSGNMPAIIAAIAAAVK